MRFPAFMLVVLGLLVGVGRADDSAAARALIDEAIRAHGGEEALAQGPVVTVKTEGIFHGYERTPVFFFTCETTTHGPDQVRAVLDGELDKQKFRVANVLDGKQGWILLAGENKRETQACTPAQLFEMRESGYISWVTRLVPLRGGEFTLALAGEEKLGDRPTVGVRVSSQGHRDVILFFDKETRLLIKTQTRATAGTGREGKVETLLRLHKTIQGVQRPTMWVDYHDGRPLISHWVLDYRSTEKPESGTFAKP